MKKYDLLNWIIATAFAGFAAGASGMLAILLLQNTAKFAQHLAAGSALGVPLVLAGAGVIAGFIWWWIRLKKTGSIAGVVQKGEDTFLPGRSSVDAALQVASVGFGASMGREAAPRLLAATVTWAAGRRLPRDMRVLVTAGAAGGALGVVYDAPLAGAIYTLTILLPTLEWCTVLTAFIASYSGVTMAQHILGEPHNYTLGTVEVTGASWAWILVCAVLAPVIGLTFKGMQKRFISGKVPIKILPLTVGAGFGVVGLVALVRPEIMGNGVTLVQHSFLSDLNGQTFLLLLVLKALLTVLVLSAGAVGGVLMPAFSLGACLGAAGAYFVPGSNSALFVLMTAAAVLSVTEKSWAFGICFALELVDAPMTMWIPVGLACLAAFYVARAFQNWQGRQAAAQA